MFDLFFGNISDSFGKKVTLGLFPRCLQPVKSTLFQVPRHEGSGPECQRASGRPERSGRWIQSRVCHSWPIPVCEKWGSKNVGVKHLGAYFPFLQKPAFPLMGEIVGLWPLYKMKASPFHSFNAPQTLLLDSSMFAERGKHYFAAAVASRKSAGFLGDPHVHLEGASPVPARVSRS